ncbi:CPBP family intramembrane glutamic endopeptidase [Chitinophaga pinensis]|uniref:Abortive infection protein n=1 Tax=Chitinophaga pinensis (strain ATCC 43595 / DSM 2588 / LMG 13176 / NBRC 15968 / NCIMB 11800 / UQM 2034) TaxID=485918 RepID=A0A979G3V8_CHIPD|nr:type II CAAX endopeptidase family protein [Chitinophaga pinensis]ACU60302.1 Abortive infection protein [Chitinophaga pinensis DSM 2588]
MEQEFQNEVIHTLNVPQSTAKVAYPDIKSLFRIFGIMLLCMMLIGIAGAVITAIAGDRISPLLKSLLSFISYTMGLLLTIRYAAKRSEKWQHTPLNLSINKIQPVLIPVIIISTLALVVGMERLAMLIPMPEVIEKMFEDLFKNDLFSIITIVIAAPLLEETLCRGIVLKGLLKRYPPRKAIIISALFFGLIHMNPWQALPAFCIGLFMGWLFYKTNSIIPGIIVHATNNGTAALFLFFPKDKQDILGLVGMPYYIILCIAAALIIVLSCIYLHRKARALKPAVMDIPAAQPLPADV